MSQDCVEQWQSSQQQTEGEILTVAELEYKMVPPTVPGKYENQPSPVNYFMLEALIFFRLPKRLRTRSRPRLGHMGQPADACMLRWTKGTLYTWTFSTVLTISSPPSPSTAHGTPADRAAPSGITSQPAASVVDSQAERWIRTLAGSNTHHDDNLTLACVCDIAICRARSSVSHQCTPEALVAESGD